MLGLTSAGSGTLIAVALIIGYRLKPRRVVGTDVFHAALLLWIASIAHFASGDVDLLLDGQHPDRLDPWRVDRLGPRGRAAGGRAAARAGYRPARRGLALLNKAGLDFPVSVIFLVPVVVALGLTALHFGRERAARMRAPLPIGEPTHPPTPESA